MATPHSNVATGQWRAIVALAFAPLLLAEPVALQPTVQTPLEPRSALIIAINRYADASYAALRFAENDALALQRVLAGQGYTVTLLVGERATASAIRNAILRARESGTISLFMSGYVQ